MRHNTAGVIEHTPLISLLLEINQGDSTATARNRNERLAEWAACDGYYLPTGILLRANVYNLEWPTGPRRIVHQDLGANTYQEPGPRMRVELASRYLVSSGDAAQDGVRTMREIMHMHCARGR